MIKLEFLCKERRGEVLREVREVQPSSYLDLFLMQKLKGMPSPVDDFKQLYEPRVRIFLVDNVGALFQGPLEFDGLPDVHIAFWDRILAGREQMCYTVAALVARDAGTPGVFTAIPKASRATLAFARRVGFKTFRETKTVEVLSLYFVHDVHRETQWDSRQ